MSIFRDLTPEEKAANPNWKRNAILGGLGLCVAGTGLLVLVIGVAGVIPKKWFR